MPSIKGPRKIGRYTDEFKVKAVRLTFLQGTQIQEVANALDIHPFMLSRWRKEYREGKYVADRRIKKVVDDEAVYLCAAGPAPATSVMISKKISK
jgi:transposase-like protein